VEELLMDREQLYNEIREIVADTLEVEEDEINGDAIFVEEYDVDSMLALEILASIEKKYKIKIPEERLANITTLNETISLTQEFIDK
jgi:acyl carrier protein